MERIRFYCGARFLRELVDMGFAGVQNFPTVGLIDGTFRVNLEEDRHELLLEVELIAEAHELDLLTTPYVLQSRGGAPKWRVRARTSSSRTLA